MANLEALLQQIMSNRAGPDDSLIILPVTNNSVWQMQVLGRNDLDIEDLSGERHTLII